MPIRHILSRLMVTSNTWCKKRPGDNFVENVRNQNIRKLWQKEYKFCENSTGKIISNIPVATSLSQPFVLKKSREKHWGIQRKGSEHQFSDAMSAKERFTPRQGPPTSFISPKIDHYLHLWVKRRSMIPMDLYYCQPFVPHTLSQTGRLQIYSSEAVIPFQADMYCCR